MIADPAGAVSAGSALRTDEVAAGGVVPVIVSDHSPVYVERNLTQIKKNRKTAKKAAQPLDFISVEI